MFYYVISHLLTHLKHKKQFTYNIQPVIFVTGSLCWLLLAGFLWNPKFYSIVTGNFFLFTLQTFFQWAIFIDIGACSLLQQRPTEYVSYEEQQPIIISDNTTTPLNPFPISTSDSPLTTTIIEETSSEHMYPITENDEVTQDIIEDSPRNKKDL